MRRKPRLSIIALALAAIAAAPAAAQAPLSASDWLSGGTPPAREASGWRPGDPRPQHGATPDPAQTRTPSGPPVARTGSVGRVTVSRLDGGDPDAAGTITPAAAGLPADLWAGSDPATLAGMIARTPARLPAMTALMQRLLLVQLPPPPGDSARGELFLARADRLLEMGDLAAARALLIQQAGNRHPEVYRRLFDIAMLDGNEGQACAMMNRTPGISPGHAARIFCLAQSGDWSAAAIVLHGAGDLGLIDPPRIDLLHQFMDDSYVDSGQALTPPDPLTPLDFRMMEAVGQPLPTAPLPIAFAHSDLRPSTGWKARLEAAERLAAAGVLPAAEMQAIYAEQRPAASGGVWERAAAVQALAAPDGITDAALIRADTAFATAGFSDVLAAIMAPRMSGLSPDAPAAQDALARLRDWTGEGPAPTLPDPADPPADRKGEALMRAMADIDAGIDEDETRAARGLSMLRALGLERDAALAAGQIPLERQQAAHPR